MLGEKCRSLSAAVGGPRLILDAVVPAMMRDKAIYRGEVDARLPFSGRDRGSHIFRSSGVNVHGGTGMQGEGMGMLSVRSAAVAWVCSLVERFLESDQIIKRPRHSG